MSLPLSPSLRVLLFTAAAGLATPVAAQQITLTGISTPFNSPVGIDHHQPTNSVIISVNYSSGQPHNLERIEFDGTHVQFSDVAGFTDEVKIATVRPGNVGGFTVGDLFVGNGVDGQVVRITDDGATVINPWVDLPGGGNGLMRGSLYVDRTGVWGGNLIICTTVGEVWRITSAGVPTFVGDVNTHLEGLVTVPNDPRFGPLAGKAIAGAEEQSLLYAFGTDGSVQTYAVGVNIEDIDLIPDNENFFGVNFGTSRLLGAQAADFDGIEGDILLTQETHSGSGLFRLFWDGTMLQATALTLNPASAPVGQWEHVTFSPAGIVEIDAIPVCTLSVGDGALIGTSVGVPVSFTVTGSDPDPQDVTEVSVSGLPTGATMSPALPASGNPVSSTFNWVPGGSQVGTHKVDFTVTDMAGQQSTCSVTIEVAECYLCLGIASANQKVSGEETLLVQPIVWFPVTLQTIPVLQIPNDPALTGLHIFAQVWMLNPILFPADPVKASNGLATAIGGGSSTYGAAKGLQLWSPAPADPGGSYTIKFSIDAP